MNTPKDQPQQKSGLTKQQYTDLVSDLVEKHFPKGKTTMRGEAMVLVAEILVELLKAGVVFDGDAARPTQVKEEQQALIDFVTDPVTIAKAVEGSMDKRLAVLDAESQGDELDGLKIEIMDPIFRPIGPCDDVVVSYEALQEWVAQHIQAARLNAVNDALGIINQLEEADGLVDAKTAKLIIAVLGQSEQQLQKGQE